MNITSIKRSIPVREAELSEAFLELQFSINRLAQMARLAECQLDHAVGGLGPSGHGEPGGKAMTEVVTAVCVFFSISVFLAHAFDAYYVR